jgi:acyl dehydratase
MAWSLFQAQLSRRFSALAPGQDLPSLKLTLESARAPKWNLRRYRFACRFEKREYLPITYPHILAAPLHTALVADPVFPLKLLGLVHLRNEIIQYRQIHQDEEMRIEVSNTGLRQLDAGQEFDILTEISVDGDTVWRETTTVLARQPNRKKRERAPQREADPEPEETSRASWQVRAYYGRRYARISKDFNPIHLTQRTARWFGFRHAIAHGMWTLARCLAAVDRPQPLGAVHVEARFMLPVYLPAWVTFVTGSAGDRLRFRLLDASGRRPHLLGWITPVKSET